MQNTLSSVTGTVFRSIAWSTASFGGQTTAATETTTTTKDETSSPDAAVAATTTTTMTTTSTTELTLIPPIPVVVARTDESMTLVWMFPPPPSTSSDAPAPIAATTTAHSELLDIGDAERISLLGPELNDVEFEVTYWRPKYKFDQRVVAGTCRKCTLVVCGLEANVSYQFSIRVRGSGNNAATPGATNTWSTYSVPSRQVSTLPREVQERLENIRRVRQLIVEGMDSLPRFPEDPYVPDTLSRMAQRSFEGLMYTTTAVGIGGAYLAAVKGAWRIQKTGLASLIFDSDMQQTVYVLLSFLNVVTKEINMTSRDVAVGSYFALWEAKRERLLHPMNELLEHAQGAQGVIATEAPKELVDELMWFLPLAAASYRKSKAEIQWVLDQFPTRRATLPDSFFSSTAAARNHKPLEKPVNQTRGFRLISARCKSEKFKPAFLLAVNEDLKMAVFAVRGTSDYEDLVTDGLCDVTMTSFQFHKDSEGHSPHYHVHAGMLQAARWLVKGDDHSDLVFDNDNENDESKKQQKEKTKSGDDDDDEGAGIGASVAKLWTAGYEQIILTGHSLGAGVAVLTALLLADQFRDIRLRVYGFGTPACVDERLAEACKGRHGATTTLPGLGHRVTVKNVVNHDDIIPRLSIKTAAAFASDLKATRNKWGPLLNEDIAGFTQRIKTVWAPSQRAQSKIRGGPQERVRFSPRQQEDGEGASTTKQQEEEQEGSNAHAERDDIALRVTDERLKRSLENWLAPPGLVVHTYLHHGTHRASLVDYTFPPLRRVEAFQTCIDDHRLNNILSAMRSASAARQARSVGRHPPHWESLRDHVGDATEWQVTCRVCKYPVSWCHTSTSEASEIRATYHCHSCGMIVCAQCSETKVPLPSIGILNPVRVCDICLYKLGFREPNGLNDLEIGETVGEF